MEQTMLPVDPTYGRQAFAVNIKPNGRAKTLRVELEYRAYVGKYFMTVIDMATGEDVLRNFPVVASAEGALNDLLKQVAYKLCGSLICFPLLKETSFEDPCAAFGEYELIWGDSPWTS